MIKVVSFKICPFVQRVTALLEAKDIPYELEYIRLADKPDWFLQISPNAQVPLLITESGTPLFESDAIVEYIDEVHSPLEPGISAEQRAIDRAWSYQATRNYLVQCGAMSSADKATLLERAEKLGAVFAKVEKAMGAGPFFNGSTLGNVDIAWMVLLHRADIIRRYSGYDFLAKYPKVQAWQLALMQTGLAEKSVALDFEQSFTEFYLSEKTVLGRGENCEAVPVATCAGSSCC